MVERSKLAKNPFAGIRIRGVKGTSDSNSKGFSDAQAAVILTATLATPSDLTTPETRAARRWVPWACAYSGARVTEITSLLPGDIRQDHESGIWCLYIRPEMTKGDYARVVPIHSHLIEQGFLDFVEKRRVLKLPLFYDPKRARGGTNANPQYQKVGERLGEWVREVLKITGVKPNHGWRHRFKSVSREVGMHPEVEKLITGHGGSDDAGEIEKVSLRYGDKWVKTLAKNIEMYPRYRITVDIADPNRRALSVEYPRARPLGNGADNFSSSSLDGTVFCADEREKLANFLETRGFSSELTANIEVMLPRNIRSNPLQIHVAALVQALSKRTERHTLPLESESFKPLAMAQARLRSIATQEKIEIDEGASALAALLMSSEHIDDLGGHDSKMAQSFAEFQKPIHDLVEKVRVCCGSSSDSTTFLDKRDEHALSGLCA